MYKKQAIAVIIVSLLLGIWFTVSSLFLTLNYIEEKSDLEMLEFGLPFQYLTQDCTQFKPVSIPTTLSICDPYKYPISISPLKLSASLAINIGVPFGIIYSIVVVRNIKSKKKEKKMNT